MILSILAYVGLAFVLLGIAAAIRPIRRLGLPSRSRGTGAALIGAVLLGASSFWPTPLVHATGSAAIDDAMREYQFVEHHEIVVAAAPSEIYAALRQVTAREIRFFGLLTWMRNPRIRNRRESILEAPADKPIIDVALAGGFRLLSERPPTELVIEARVAPRVRAVMNFLIVPDASGRSRLSTETRVVAADSASLRQFALYWRLIYPGSSIIRTEWLRAIERRVALQLSGR